MSRLHLSSHSLAWPRIAALALVGAAVAGCSNSARFDAPYPTAQVQQQRQFESTGSIARTPPHSRVYSQPLPSPVRPATVATSGGYSNGAAGLGAYRPNGEVTGSIAQPAPAPNGYWTWDGGQPVTVGYGESAEMIARKYGVPESALLQTNGITNPTQIQAGQRLVIPRYIAASAQPVPQAPQLAPQPMQPAPAYGGNVHTVAPGESLIGIARHYRLSLNALARFNNIDPYTKLNVGDRINIPPGRQTAAQPVRATAPAAAARPLVAPPRIAQAHSTPVEKVAAVPPQTARMATPEPATPAAATAHAEAPAAANAGMPSFRWPVHGRVIAAFGSRPNGVQNDGINLAVPEGTAVKAADDGVVAYAGNELKGYGNLVLIRHANGFVSAYANASDLTVKRGDTIKRGQVIAHAGQTGNVTSPQLHFEIRKGSTPVDPTKYLSGV